MTTLVWIIAGVIAWILAAITVGYLWHRIRRHQRPSPSPNHPAARAHKQFTDDKPLDPHETAAWNQLEEQLR